ncbi:PREDICTED: uncharacterized protein LOC106314771 [Brassica oleracea var. oleracea]|uniref:uncharacterized protein LOC106314771 n=1 Tax=Brassica oleracea var. oleracea TaxID=109376 RepID=UPI0006A74925|nr:PREDICTED: uncharacterized protein LOC106314771 [Brassica oleracea var. oleracea]
MYACLNCGKGPNFMQTMLDKSWVHLCRVDSAYERGARGFVNAVTAKLGVNGKIVRSDWFHHGDGHAVAVVEEAETPLYPTCASHSKLSAVVSLFRINSQNGWSDKSFDDLLQTLPNMLPEDNVMHTSTYDVKKFLKSFDMGYHKIHACVNDCCFFRKKLKTAESCPKCKASRWKTNMHTGEFKKGVPQKVLRYFPLIPHLKRMFRSEQLAMDLRWHFNNKSTDGKLRHPVDHVTWQSMNDKYPSFAAEERNLRLGLSTDGFNPFSMKNSRYSCWPVLLVNYNMAPDLCMKEENIMLSLLIPGPHQLGNSIDVYLEPLMEDLNHLWCIGELTYNAVSKTTFTLKAMLLWTISDFPAYGNLAGCKVQGKMGCPICGKHTDSLWLSNSRKFVFMGHRKCLPPLHSFRGKKTWFDGKTEHGTKGRILMGRNVSFVLRNYKNVFGNRKQSGKKRAARVDIPSDNEDEVSESDEDEDLGDKDEEELSRWKKRSIFFTLPYWEELPIRHNLDVMHVERNVAASLIATLLHCGNSKDGLKARKDLESLGIRKDLHPKAQGREARLGGPVHFRWMYPFERYMKVLKDYVRNTARPEGCIAESYLAEECMKNTEYESHSILEGRPISAGRSFTLTDTDKKIAHLAVIQNTAMVDPYVDAHLQHLQDSNSRCKRDATYLWRMHTEKFAAWLKQQIPIDSEYEEETLKWLAYGPRSISRSYTGYIVNGLRFHTNSVHRLSQNSGVYYEATAMCRSSARDTAQVVDVVSYYGRVVDIILLDYNAFYVPIFRCQWAVKGNGVKVEDGFTLVNFNHSHISFAKDPFILASQARQIFYSRENDESSWYVVMKGPSRRYSDEKVEDLHGDVGPLPSDMDMSLEDISDEAENVRDDFSLEFDCRIAMGKGKKQSKKRKTIVQDDEPVFIGTIYPGETQQDMRIEESQPEDTQNPTQPQLDES